MSHIFPASYSTLCSSALALFISEKYGLGAIRCQLMVRGVGDTYSVESASHRFIWRVYRSSHRSLPQIKAETELLLALKQAEVPVSYPIADLSGEFIQAVEAVEGMRYAVLFSYAPGHWKLDLETTLFRPLEMVKPIFTENAEEYVWWQTAAGQIEKKIGQINTAEFSTGYCHYDLLPKNFHFVGDSITFFDFDFLGYGWLVNDIMTFWFHLSLDVHFGRMSQESASASYAVFIAAYREHRLLSDDELALVPYLLPGFMLFGTAFHMTHDHFYPFIQPGHLKMRTSLVRQLTERYWR